MSSKAYDVLALIADRLIANKDYLTDLDREIGDADHGINMARGFTLVKEQLPKEETDIGVLFKKTAMILISNVGGASGPLYGTAFMRAGAVMSGKTGLDPETLSGLMKAAVKGIQDRGKAVQGEKTMLDALIPAQQALEKAMADQKSLAGCLEDMAAAAAEGVEWTKTVKATKGRASYLGERSIGHADPGAASSTIMLEAVRDHFLAEGGA